MNQRVVRVFNAQFDLEARELLAEIARDELTPAVLRSGGLRVQVLSGSSPDGAFIDACIVAEWPSVEQSSASFADADVSKALYKLLGQVRGDYGIKSYFLDSEAVSAGSETTESFASALSAAPTVEPLGAVGLPAKRVHEQAALYRAPIDLSRAPAAELLRSDPILRATFLGGAGLDMLTAAEESDAELTRHLLESYRRDCRGALDDLGEGQIDPRSRTAHHFHNIVRLQRAFPDLAQRSIVEIGGGFGNCARMMMQMGLCRDYCLVDVSKVVDLQRAYLDQVLAPELRARVEVLNIEDDADVERLGERPAGVMFSLFGLSETAPDMQDWYLRLAKERADGVYIAGAQMFSGRSVVEHIRSSLSTVFTVELDYLPAQAAITGPPFEIVARR